MRNWANSINLEVMRVKRTPRSCGRKILRALLAVVLVLSLSYVALDSAWQNLMRSDEAVDFVPGDKAFAQQTEEPRPSPQATPTGGAAKATQATPKPEATQTPKATEQPEATPAPKAGKEYNILLAGLDRRPGQKTGRSDSMMLLNINPQQNTIKIISFMRDLYVDIPGYSANRLNAAYVKGGPNLLIKTLKQNFGVEIDDYVAVDFMLLADVVDQLGGLELTVEQKNIKAINAIIRDYNRLNGESESSGLIQKAGKQTLSGKQVQAYARFRYGTADGDFGRTARQREVVEKVLKKASGLSAARLTKIAAQNISKVKTSLSLGDIAGMLPLLSRLPDMEISQLRIPANGEYSSRNINGMAVLVPNLTKARQRIQRFLDD